jgi:hypothetical protein
VKRAEDLDAMLAEVRKHDGIQYFVTEGGKHKRLVLRKDGKQHFVTFSRTASDRRALLNKVSDVRRAIKELVK